MMNFSDVLIDVYGAKEVYKLTDMTDSTIIASVDTEHNGTVDGGLTTQSLAVPFEGDSGLAPYFDGTSNYNLLGGFPTNLGDIFNEAEHTILVFAQIDEEDWVSSSNRNFWWASTSSNYTDVSANNEEGLRKISSGDLRWRSTYDGFQWTMTTDYENHGAPTGWTMYARTFNEGNNEIAGYINDQRVMWETFVAQNWTTSLTYLSLGGKGGSNIGFKGHLAYFAIFDRALTPADIFGIYCAAGLS